LAITPHEMLNEHLAPCLEGAIVSSDAQKQRRKAGGLTGVARPRDALS
jgi:hypothetical protein